MAAYGLGVAATACGALAALAAARLTVPLWLGHSAEVPAFVGADVLVFAVSDTGRTPETLAAAATAIERGARMVAVGGGPDDALAGLAAASSGRAVWLPGVTATPSGRTPLPGLVVAPLVVLAHCGVSADLAPSLKSAAGELAARRDAFLVPGGPAEEVARRIGRTVPLIYGSSGIGATAARWWKQRVNCNAKAPAFASELPALAYDEVAGWGQGGDVTRQVLSLVLLRHGGESEGTAALVEAVTAATEEVMADVIDVSAQGDDDVCRFFDLALLGELVSLHLAGKEGVDPGPTPAIDETHVETYGH